MMDIYALKLDFQEKIEPMVVEQLLNFVDPEKKERLKRFYRREDTLRGLFADLLSRYMIRQKTGIPNENISFDVNDFGKPFLKNRSDVQFNLSHSGEWVVGAIDKHDVGVDVERIQKIDLGISQNYFSPDEHKDLMNKPDKYDYFFTLWSLKESYIKILGKGLSHPLNAFSIKFTNPEDIVIKVEDKPIEEVFFRKYDIDRDYKMALCARHEKLPSRVNILSPEQLIGNFVN